MAASDRARLLEYAALPAHVRVACVRFDVRPSECERRIAALAEHPTLRGGGTKIQVAVRSMAKAFEAPEANEGFTEVIVIRSFADMDALL